MRRSDGRLELARTASQLWSAGPVNVTEGLERKWWEWAARKEGGLKMRRAREGGRSAANAETPTFAEDATLPHRRALRENRIRYLHALLFRYRPDHSRTSF